MNYYLSRIRLNPLRSGTQPLLSNPHKMKTMVLGGIPDRDPQQSVLWRLDTADRHQPRLLVLTPGRPAWDHIVERAGWPGADGDDALIREYEPLLAHLAIGREFAFRLKANPVYNTSKPEKLTENQKTSRGDTGEQQPGDRRRGLRLGHRTPRHQLAWFLNRVPKSGFEIPPARSGEAVAPGMPEQGIPAPDVRITESRRLSFRKKRADDHPITLMTATFEGRLRVTDPAALRQALLTGFGPAKRYGCGLLTLAPIKEDRTHG
jgi:CRISPR system Cascade subunit CasE